MPITKSAIKRARQSIKRRERNAAIKGKIKKLSKLAKKSDAEALKKAVSAIDKAVAKGMLHRNTAARKKSRLVKSIKKAKKS